MKFHVFITKQRISFALKMLNENRKNNRAVKINWFHVLQHPRVPKCVIKIRSCGRLCDVERKPGVEISSSQKHLGFPIRSVKFG